MKRESIELNIEDKNQVFNWIYHHQHENSICLFNSNGHEENFDLLIGIGLLEQLNYTGSNSFQNLQNFHDQHRDFVMGYLSYDLKNELEPLGSSKSDFTEFPGMYFFVPHYVLRLKKNKWELLYNKSKTSINKVKEFENQLLKQNKNLEINFSKAPLSIKSRITEKAYLEAAEQLKQQIKLGQIYEINFCQEFYSENTVINPFATYLKLNGISPNPFSVFFNKDEHSLMCSSPERFIKKKNQKIYSQPIKGTIRRGKDDNEDLLLINELKHSEKERSENIMIVDLVRNDLSKTAEKASVMVDELCEIYSFSKVHQMISTISSTLRKDLKFTDAIKHAFPMGSMTGAPKYRAMELIEEYESSKRGLYSGAVGYIDPQGDFDFNVVIRSILYNKLNKYLSFSAGSALTAKADPKKEYQECQLKIQAMLECLKN